MVFDSFFYCVTVKTIYWRPTPIINQHRFYVLRETDIKVLDVDFHRGEGRQINQLEPDTEG